MAKTIMISGPHGIGKTTTAQEVSEKLGYFFVGSVAAIVAKQMGFNIDKNFNPVDISAYQFEILKASEFIFTSTSLIDTVCDRSPLDWAVYLTLALENEMGFDNVIEEYRKLCVEFLNNTCNILVIPEADLSASYESKEGRPEFTKHQIEYRKRYAAELDSLVTLVDPKVKVIRVPIEHQYDDRTNFIVNKLSELNAVNNNESN